MFLRDVIKKECWDSMAVKGRGLKGFHLVLLVTNYPMRERSAQELDELAFVMKQRKIECSENEARKAILGTMTSNIISGKK